MTACRPNIGHRKQTGITFPHQEWNPASGTFRKMPAVQPDSFCLKSDWTHTTAFPNQGPPMTHDWGVGLDHLLSLLIHLMTYLEKDKFSKMGVKTMRTSEAQSLQVFFCSNQAGGRRYARCRCHLSMFVSWKLASVCNLGRVKVQYHKTLKCTGSYWAHYENVVCSKPSNY